MTTKTLTHTEKAKVREYAISLWAAANARHPMIRKDGSVVVTIDGTEGTSQIFVGWDADLLKSC